VVDRGVAEQQGDLVDRNPGQQHLDRERIPEHVRMAALQGTVGARDVG